MLHALQSQLDFMCLFSFLLTVIVLRSITPFYLLQYWYHRDRCHCFYLSCRCGCCLLLVVAVLGALSVASMMMSA